MKVKIIVVQARRDELEAESRLMAADALPEGKLEQLPSAYEAPIQAPCDTSATFLHTNPRRLFVESSPFLSELAQQDMDKALSIHDNVYRWLSRL